MWMNLGDFQDVESNYRGRLSHVPSQPAMIPSSRSMLSRDKRLPRIHLDYRKTFFFFVNFLRWFMPRDHPQRIQSDDVQRNREAVPEAWRAKTIHTSEDRLNQGTTPMPTSATKPWTRSSTMPVEFPQSYKVWQRRQQISELQFDKFTCPQSSLVWKIRFKTQVTACSDFPSDAMLWIKEVEMVGSVDQLKSSRSTAGKDFPNFENAKIASALNKIIQNSQFKKKVSLEEQKAQKKRTGFDEEDRSPSWFSTTFEWLGKETDEFSATKPKIVRRNPEHTAATSSEPTVSRGRSVSRKRSIRGKSNYGSILRQPCRYYLGGTRTRTSCDFWHPPECQCF